MILAPFFMLWLAGSYALAMLLNLIIAGMLLREFAERKTDVKKYLISAICAVFLMFIAIPVILKNLNLLPPLLASTVAIFPILFISAYFLSGKLFDRAKNIAITYSCGMKNLTALPIAYGCDFLSNLQSKKRWFKRLKRFYIQRTFRSPREKLWII